MWIEITMVNLILPNNLFVIPHVGMWIEIRNLAVVALTHTVIPHVGIREDWHYIKDAMRLRDVSPTVLRFLKAPKMTVNCIYVPLLTAASKAADELSIASVTRGIENPRRRHKPADVQNCREGGKCVPESADAVFQRRHGQRNCLRDGK